MTYAIIVSTQSLLKEIRKHLPYKKYWMPLLTMR